MICESNYSPSVLVHAAIIGGLVVDGGVCLELTRLLDLLLDAVQRFRDCVLQLQLELLVVTVGNVSHLVLLEQSERD